MAEGFSVSRGLPDKLPPLTLRTLERQVIIAEAKIERTEVEK